MTADRLDLRAHHLLCLQGFVGRGYSEAFVANMRQVKERLEQYSIMVEVHAQADAICRVCPHLETGARCARAPDRDRAVLAALGVEPATVRPWEWWLRRVAARITPSQMESICRGCSWLPHGLCLAGLAALRDRQGGRKMDFYEVIGTRRSIRSFQDKPIPHDVLERVLTAARIAPSGSNRQPWRFIVVADAELKRSLVAACHNQGFIATAPVVVAACGCDIRFDRGDWMGEYSFLVDVVIAMDHLILAARAEGLGSCWIGSFSDEQVKAMLKVPEGWHVVALTPLGYPAGDLFTEVGERKPLDEIVYGETWGKGIGKREG